MSKLSFAIVIIFVGLIMTGIVIFTRNQTASPISQNNPSPTMTPTPKPGFKKYSDPAGFNFEYPNSLILTPKKPLPANAYAKIELTTAGDNAVITLNVEDTNITTLEKPLTATSSTSLQLADLSAIQYINKNIMTTIALDQGVLFTLTLNPANAKETWINAYNKIVASLTIAAPESSSTSSSGYTDDGGGEDVIFEGEEVVE